MAITLAEIKLQARQRADMEEQPFIGEGELTAYVNNSIAELYDILCEAYESEYNVTSVDGDISADTAAYSLPDDFYELKGVDVRLSGTSEWITIERYNFNERNRYQEARAWSLHECPHIRYRIVGNNLNFTPTPDTAAEYRLHYVPLATKLVDEDDELDDLNAYSEYVIVDVAIKMLQKEESDVQVLLLQKQALEKRIRDKAQARDAGQADTIQDIYAVGDI